MTAEPKLAPIRKGLLEFLVLKIVGARSVYVPDILRRLADTEFATQEGTLYPLLSIRIDSRSSVSLICPAKRLAFILAPTSSC